MTTPAPAASPEAADIYSVVALALLRVGRHTLDDIEVRTGIDAATLRQLASEHGITLDWHGTAYGVQEHIARGEDPCFRCQNAQASKKARALAQQRVREAERLHRARTRRIPSRRRTATRAGQRAGGGAA